jgi:hypothetical protein
MGKKISILLPTRGRAEQLEKSVRSLLGSASGIEHLEILFAVDSDDSVGMEHFLAHISPYIENLKITNKIIITHPMGYENLHNYVNILAKEAQGQWLFFWNDDAVMQTANWDLEIDRYSGQFKLLSVHTHNEHPYSIFPIIPRQWYDILGHISLHSLNDAWVSTIAYMLDIFERIPVWVEHDRHDLTGNNNDATYQRRKILEGNPLDPRDFNHVTWRQQRLNDAATLATWMQNQGLDLSFFASACQGQQDPWQKLRENDVNNQITDRAP